MNAEATMTRSDFFPSLAPEALADAADRAVRAIPPVWPLASSVAVNPYLGQAQESLATAGARLARVAGAPMTLPRRGFLDQIARGGITDADLTAALELAPRDLRPPTVAALKAVAQTDAPVLQALPTVADLAAEVSGLDWPGLIAERFGACGPRPGVAGPMPLGEPWRPMT